jgi:hypothetical protein
VDERQGAPLGEDDRPSGVLGPRAVPAVREESLTFPGKTRRSHSTVQRLWTILR